MTVGVLTDDSVTSAELLINGTAYPLDSIGAGQFGRELVLGDVGSYAMVAVLYVDGSPTRYEQSDLIVSVQPGDGVQPLPNQPFPNPTPTNPSNPAPSTDITGIGTIKAVIDANNKTTAHLSWTTIGTVDYFLVRYGENPGFLDKQIIVIDDELSLEDLPANSTLYVQVWPADAQGTAQGIPSDPVTLELGSNAPACVVR